MLTSPPRHSPATVAAILTIDRGVYRFARHWLLGLNALALPFAALPLAAPVLRAEGSAALAAPIYAYFGLVCHGRADRSFHVLGERMACCQRCAAIYGALLLAGLLFALVRPRLRPLSWTGVALTALPMAVDGFGQAAGLWDSSALSRVLTGALFAVGLSWLLLPHLEVGFADMRRQLETRFARLVAEGRTRPLRGAPPPPPAA